MSTGSRWWSSWSPAVPASVRPPHSSPATSTWPRAPSTSGGRGATCPVRVTTGATQDQAQHPHDRRGGRHPGQADLTGKWVFTNSGRSTNGGPNDPVRGPNFYTNVWVPALARAKEAGLTKKPRVHDLRHTNASWLIQAGIHLTVVQRDLGHESIQTTSDRYGHLDRPSSRVVAHVVSKASRQEGTKSRTARDPGSADQAKQVLLLRFSP